MTPQNEEELAAIIRDAKGPLSIRGGGTRGLSVMGEPLSTAEMTGITLYEPGALTVVARAGTPVAEIEAALAEENQRLAFEPMDHCALSGTDGTPTIGGVIAANISGPRRIAVGAARDFTLGVRFVDGSGEIIKNGGRVMKNVTGYDLVKLMSGACGTLGVLTEVSFKVLPVPETQATLVLRGLTDTDAVRTMARALGSPFEVTGAAHDGETLLRLEGFEASVTYRAQALRDALVEFDAEIIVMDAEASADRWRGIRDVTSFADQPGDVWRLSCKPSDGPELAKRAGAAARLFDWAGGLIWLCVPEGTDLRADLGEFDGHVTLVRASPETKRRLNVFHPEAPGVARLSQGLRDRFDPRGILNPGLMGGGRYADDIH